MLPKTLALIDDDPQYTEFLSHYLQQRGTEVKVFEIGRASCRERVSELV